MTFTVAGVQFDDSPLRIVIDKVSVDKTFNNYKEPVYDSLTPIVFPVSANTPDYTLDFTVWGRGQVWTELLDKEMELKAAIESSILSGSPIPIVSSTTPLFLDQTSINVWLEDIAFNKRATDGKNFISYQLSGLFDGVFSPPIVSPGQGSGIGSLGIGSFMIGSS